jgi:hypothetical protein
MAAGGGSPLCGVLIVLETDELATGSDGRGELSVGFGENLE